MEASRPFDDFSFIYRMISFQPAGRMRSTLRLWDTRVCHLVSSVAREPIPSRRYYFSFIAFISVTAVSCSTVLLVENRVIRTFVEFLREIFIKDTKINKVKSKWNYLLACHGPLMDLEKLVNVHVAHIKRQKVG